MNKTNLAYILLVLTTIFWSGNFIVGKAATIYDIPPFSLNFFSIMLKKGTVTFYPRANMKEFQPSLPYILKFPSK